MLSRDRRVGTALYDRIMKEGVSLHSSHFSLRFIQNTESHLRIGVAVSKKVEKQAVKRNRIKRLIRVSLSELTKSLDGPKAVIFFAKSGVPELAKQARTEEIKELLQKTLAK